MANASPNAFGAQLGFPRGADEVALSAWDFTISGYDLLTEVQRRAR